MGDSETKKTSTQTTTPYKPLAPALQSLTGGLNAINPTLTGNEMGAINSLVARAGQPNEYAPAISRYANELLSGGTDRTGIVNDAYAGLRGNLEGTARGDYLNPSTNPWFDQVTSKIGNDVQSRLGGLYAGSGRDPAGAGNFGGWLGRGIAEGAAPIFAQAYENERGRQMGAANTLFNAGGQTASMLSGLDQTRLGNQGAGIGASEAAYAAGNDPYNRTLQAEGLRRSIPMSILGQLEGMVGPLAEQFGVKSGTETTTTPTNWAQLGTGLAIAGMGAMSGNPFAAMGGLNGVLNGMSPMQQYNAGLSGVAQYQDINGVRWPIAGPGR